MSDENKVSAEVNGSEPFAEARGSGAPELRLEKRLCPLCDGRGKRMVWFGRKLQLTVCCDCNGKGHRPVRPNSD